MKIVIGSGPSGTACAHALLAQGEQASGISLRDFNAADA